MPFSSASPYDILGVDPSTPLAEITRAYQKALKERRYPPPMLAQAFSDLRNSRSRVIWDLLTSSLAGDPDELRRLQEGLPAVSFVPSDSSPVPFSMRSALLAILDPSNENRELAPLPDAEFGAIPEFGDAESVLLPVRLPL